MNKKEGVSSATMMRYASENTKHSSLKKRQERLAKALKQNLSRRKAKKTSESTPKSAINEVKDFKV